METAFVNQKDDRVEVHGELTFTTVPKLCACSAAIVGCRSTVITIDMKHVSRADSAGLALMVEWLRLARDDNRQLRFIEVPQQVRQLTRVTGLDGAFAVK